MPNHHPFVRRLGIAAGVAAAIVSTVAFHGTIAGAQPAPAVVGGSIAVAAPSISALHVQAGGTAASVSFTTSEPTAIAFDLTGPSAVPAPVSPAPRGPLGDARAPLTGGATTGELPAADAYQTQHLLPLTQLTSNTTYDLVVAATTQSGQRLSAQTRFTTPAKRLRVTLESIEIEDDGDLIGKGEPRWIVDLAWTGGALTRCYPLPYPCEPVASRERRLTPRTAAGALLTFVFAEEHFDRFPETVSLAVQAREYDSLSGVGGVVDCIISLGCTVGAEAPRVWPVPLGVEQAEQRLTARGDDLDGGFKSVLTFRLELFHDATPVPAPGPNLPSSTWP
jgi:hypothetical protein